MGKSLLAALNVRLNYSLQLLALLTNICYLQLKTYTQAHVGERDFNSLSLCYPASSCVCVCLSLFVFTHSANVRRRCWRHFTPRGL